MLNMVMLMKNICQSESIILGFKEPPFVQRRPLLMVHCRVEFWCCKVVFGEVSNFESAYQKSGM